MLTSVVGLILAGVAFALAAIFLGMLAGLGPLPHGDDSNSTASDYSLGVSDNSSGWFDCSSAADSSDM